MGRSTTEQFPPNHRRHRITFCITELDPGGAERQLVRLATGLDRTRYEVDVICLSKPGLLVEPLRSSGIPVTCLDARGRRDVAVVYRLWRRLRLTRPDLVQTFLFHANIAGRVAARLAGVPIVVSGIRVAERRHRWHLYLDRLTERLVNRHVCVSHDVARFSREVAGLSPEKLVVIPNGVDADFFASAKPADLSEFGFPANAEVILFVGRLDEQKDPLLALDTFQLLMTKYPTARLLIVGTGPLAAEVRRRADRMNGRVALGGYRSDVANLMKASRCLVLPSRWEGMPNVVLEAIAAGLPVVASAAEGVRELLSDPDTGTVVPNPNPASFSAAIEEAVFGGPEGDYKGRSTQIAETYTLTSEEAINAYSRLYQAMLESHSMANPGRSL